MKTLILGLGNPIRCDDGVGNQVAKSLEKRISSPEVKVIEADTSGFGLLDFLQNFDRAIIIDAIQTPQGEVGQIHRLSLEDLAIPSQPVLTHGVDLPTAIKFGQELGLPLPQEIVIFAVEVEDTITFSEECTPKVKKTIPKLVRLVLQELGPG